MDPAAADRDAGVADVGGRRTIRVDLVEVAADRLHEPTVQDLRGATRRARRRRPVDGSRPCRQTGGDGRERTADPATGDPGRDRATRGRRRRGERRQRRQLDADPIAAPTIEATAANARWRALLAEGGPILADGAMGTMLFAAGLQFGDPPEAWNVSHPDVVRRIHRGYLDAGLADRADEHLRRQPAAAPAPRPRHARRRAEPDRGDPAPRGGRRGRRPRPRRGRHRPVGRDHGAARDARRGRGGRRLRRAGGGPGRGRRRPDLDRDDEPPLGDHGGDPRRPAGLARRSRSSRR